MDINMKSLLNAKIPCEETGIEIRRGICGFCTKSCLVDAYVKDGKIIKVEGCKSLDGMNQGVICVKGAALQQSTHHKDRLLYPMRRTGKRGEAKFQRISWEEAFSIIAENLKKGIEAYGAESTMTYIGHPKWFRLQLAQLSDALGTPNFGTDSSTCAYAKMMAYSSCLGMSGAWAMPDLGNCKTLLIWGANEMISRSNISSKPYLKLVERGANIIVVDPRCTATSEHATIHLRPIPGTDGALALGMARVMITEGLYDQNYIDAYTYGFEEYKQYVMDFTPERVEEITGVPAKDMIAAARMFGTHRPSALQMSASPVVQHINGVQNVRAIVLLCALTGSYGVTGGIGAPGKGKLALKGAFTGSASHRANADKDISREEFPAWERLIGHETQVIRMADYLEGKGNYPIHTLMAFGMNHHMWPRPDRLESAFEKLDFFVNADIYMTDTCRYADVILPVSTSLEREQVQPVGKNKVCWFPQVVTPPGEAKNDVEIIIGIADALGVRVGEPPFTSYEEYLQMTLTPTGLTLEELRENPDGMQSRTVPKERTTEAILGNIQSPTGKIEFVSQVLDGCGRPGHQGLPVYQDFRDVLPMKEYPLILSTGCRKPQYYHSRTYRLPWLAGLERFPIIETHPDTVAKLNVCDGEEVTLVTPVGKLDMPLVLDTSCLPGVVHVYHGAGDKDINYLIEDHYYDPVSGFPGFKSYCCRLEKKGE